MMPILHSSGVRIPGQFGPSSMEFDFSSLALTLTMSITGMPSVIQEMNGISASMASMIAAPAPAGGT